VATKIGSAFIDVTAETRDADHKMQALGKNIGRLAAAAGVAAAVGFGVAAKAGIDMNATLESAELQFGTLMGSAEAAEKHVASLFEFAAKTPFETEPILTASRHLLIFGGEALNTEENLTRVGDAAAALAAPMDEVAFWVGRAYSMVNSGKPFGEAAMRLQELGVISPEVRTEMEALAAAGAPVTEVWGIMEERLDTFGGAMQLQAESWMGLTSTIIDNVGLLNAQAMEPLFERAKEVAGGLAAWLQSEEASAWADRMGEAIGSVIDVAGTFITGIIDIVGFVGDLNSAMGGLPGKAAAAAAALWALAAHPVIAAVGALVFVVGQIGQEARDAEANVNSLADAIRTTGTDAIREFAEAQALMIWQNEGHRKVLEMYGVTLADIADYVEAGTVSGRGFRDEMGFGAVEMGRYAGLAGALAGDIDNLALQTAEATAFAKEADEAFADTASTFTHIATGPLPDYMDSLGEVGTSYDDLAETSTEATDQIAEDFKAAQEALDEHRDDWQRRYDEIAGSVDSFITGFEGMPESVDITMDEWQTNMETRGAYIATWFHNLQILSREGLTALVDEAVAAGPEKMGELVNSWANDIPTAENANAIAEANRELITEGSASVVNEQLLADLFTLGYDITGGIASGINSTAARQALREAMDGAIGAAVNAAERGIERSSPSRLFAREIGLPIVEGIAAGITGNLGLVTDALGGITNVEPLSVPTTRSSGAAWERAGTDSPAPILVQTTGDAEVLAREILDEVEWRQSVRGRGR
jgi:hypothetical protein